MEQEASGNEAERDILALFSPMIKNSIRKRHGRELADRAVKNGRCGYRRRVENAPMEETMKDNKGFWDRWAKRYDLMMSGDGRTYAQIVDLMKRKLNREMAVLELACGTGLLSVRLAGSVKLLEATDFSEEMIRQAKAKAHSSRLHFSVQDATSLPYTPGTFDAVVISNALHIMPEPEKALAEIKRVLKPGGILIAPTFTAAGSLSGRMRIRIMELSRFKVFYKWTPQGYLDFLEENGFEIVRRKTFDGGLKLTYAEAGVKP